jgi:hypothetical protein
VNTPNFAVRFRGQLLAEASGPYTFFVAATDYVYAGKGLLLDTDRLSMTIA